MRCKTGSCGLPRSGLPDARWVEHEPRVASEGNALNKPVRDAYRKLAQLNEWALGRQGENEQVGIIRADPGEWGLTLGDESKSRLQDVLCVVRNATETLGKVAER